MVLPCGPFSVVNSTGALTSYVAKGVDFNGSADYQLRGGPLTGASDSATGIFSCWFRLDGGNGAALSILSGSVAAMCEVFRTSSNTFELSFQPASQGQTYNFFSGTTYLSSSTGWKHILAAWDVSQGMGAKDAKTSLYISSASDFSAGTDNAGGFLVGLSSASQTNWGVAAAVSAAQKWNGALADLYFAPGQYLDFTVAANRAKFISSGKPVNLGADGSVPTGTTPQLFLHVGSTGVVGDFATNLGSGGDFTVTGAPALASDNPSD